MKNMTRSLSNQALGSVGRDLESFFDQLFSPSEIANGSAATTWMPGVTIWEEADTFGLEMELPGMTMDNIDVTFDDGRLTVHAKRERQESEGRTYRYDDRGWGEVTRAVRVPETVDPDSIEATYANGVLHIQLSKRPEVLPRKIEIKAN
ncbi:Spore protein SP21 [Rubripirellula amarantea]|uniref:Spore protein SP21 n=1 Tax=Rubripirellula amarantea TaxID=2527999 RepID=A0A5C5WV77_9BACT|nr:Hsp20/alpha crystallin family protein [Rubripirellula amarantea]TWT54874.1 Spore protein SP21 [Rubripirellula amarantea]